MKDEGSMKGPLKQPKLKMLIRIHERTKRSLLRGREI